MTVSYKRLFARSLAAAPDRLHFAAHSHHLWPDASHVGQIAAWEDAARLADRKWDRVMGELWPAAQRHVAVELNLPRPADIVFAGNTHDLLIRIVSAMGRRPVRVLATDAEFHSFRRQAARWAEAGTITLETVASDLPDFADRLIDRARSGDHDLVFASLTFFGTGRRLEGVADLAALARPEGPWLVLDGYHAFMARPLDLSAIADRAFFLAGGYKYAMSGEGVAFMHAPPDYGVRPEITGWYAEFEDLSLPPGAVGYAADAGRFLGATFDSSGLYRFVAVRDMLAAEGLDTAAVSAHCGLLIGRLAAGLTETPLGEAEWLNPPPTGEAPTARFVALRLAGAAAVQRRLLSQGIVTDVRGDVLRIGVGLYHDAVDVDRLLGALKGLAVGEEDLTIA